jgi:peroxiredoxin Q/BCP
VLGVSPDPVKKLQKFIEKDELNFTLLSDENHAVAESYGCWGLKKFMGREYMGILRQSFIIDAEGKLQHIMADVKTKTHHDDVMNWISENLAR